MANKDVTIYTDGGCEPNPGPGGYGVVLIFGKHRKELSGGYRLTTNNRMELLAVIKGLEALRERCSVKIFSDSKYIVKAINEGWIERWKARDWQRRKNQMAANHDLWKQLDQLCHQHQVVFHWVKGHNDIPENERCDQLAFQALTQENLLKDEFYENTSGLDPATIKFEKQKYHRNQTNKSYVKITQEGQPCRKCSTPVIKKIPKKRIKSEKAYYFDYYYFCPECKTMYMVEEAKRYTKGKKLF